MLNVALILNVALVKFVKARILARPLKELVTLRPMGILVILGFLHQVYVKPGIA